MRAAIKSSRGAASRKLKCTPSRPVRRLAAHRIGDARTLIAALGDVARVAEAVHQLRPGLPDAAGVPAGLGGLLGEAVAGQGRNHDVERVLRVAAVGGRVGERPDRPRASRSPSRASRA